jgi:NADH:ubiquinone oxidoreductase subunit 6 (subunit J)
MFLGSLVNKASNTNVSFNIEQSLFFTVMDVALFALVVGVAITILVGLYTGDKEKRTELRESASGIFIAFVILAVLVGLMHMFSAIASTGPVAQRFEVDEKIVVAAARLHVEGSVPLLVTRIVEVDTAWVDWVKNPKS